MLLFVYFLLCQKYTKSILQVYMKYTFSILQVYCYLFSKYTFSTCLYVLKVYAIIIRVTVNKDSYLRIKVSAVSYLSLLQNCEHTMHIVTGMPLKSVLTAYVIHLQ